mgnify:CR=1 FL=1
MELILRRQFEILVINIMMPKMDGIETLEKLKASNGCNSSTPVVALTANAINEAKELFFNEGMQDFLAKPIEQKKLDEIIQKWL